ncbi:MAG: DnaB-like helicase C-terminal domain-containing protein [Desulfobacteraceae bacterium]|jgi:replicative DNA helicase
MTPFKQIKAFYLEHLSDNRVTGRTLTAPCPFCSPSVDAAPGKLLVYINPESYFRGYFKCSNHCTPGGFYFHFGRLMGIDGDKVPGFDADIETYATESSYPPRHLGVEIDQFQSLMGPDQYHYFKRFGVSDSALKELRVGFNGRYLVYPYFLDSGFAYAARCVIPGREENHFWHGNETYAKEGFTIYNAREIERCQGGAIFITEGELNLLILKSLGYPAISVPNSADLLHIAPERLAQIENIFLLVANTPEARQCARAMATQLGFKARIVSWPSHLKRGCHLHHLAEESKGNIKKILGTMIKSSRAFSPFSSPQKERQQLFEFLENERGKTLLGLETGFSKLDEALDGLRGINILGGPPKVGKSCFFMQISTQIARRKVPVIYYDFENGRQKIYMRTLVRTSSLSEKKIHSGDLDAKESARLDLSLKQFDEMLTYFRVVTDRRLSPEIMRRHIDFLKHETHKDDLLIVLDSLHKLPFKSLTERRTGIDFWLRQIEAIRDEQHVSFLVISELARGNGGGYGDKPDMSSFKESGDIEYSADNAMILMPNWDPLDPVSTQQRKEILWLVASRENSPGQVAEYQIEYPFWRFKEI